MTHQAQMAAATMPNNMARLITDTASVRHPDDRTRALLPANEQEIYLYTTNNRKESHEISYSCLKLCNIANGAKNRQVCAYYLSSLLGLFPGLKNVALNMYRMMGVTVNVQVGRAECVSNGMEPAGEIDSRKLLVYLSQAILILFKNINIQSYDNYMRNRHKALCSFAGYYQEINDSIEEIIIDFDTANMLKTVLTSHHALRVFILEAILDNQSQYTVIGKVMGYLAGILEWTEMASIMFIFDTLFLPRSPVLFDRSVAIEVVNLAEVYKAINSVERPPYFRIMFPHSSTRIMERSKFPILLAVAQHLRAKRYSTVNQFVTTINADNTTVKRLVDVHEAGMAMATESAVDSRVDYMVTMENEFDPHLIPAAVVTANDHFAKLRERRAKRAAEAAQAAAPAQE